MIYGTGTIPFSVPCLTCCGKGYTVRRDWRGVPYPMRCLGCNGSGSQAIRS